MFKNKKLIIEFLPTVCNATEEIISLDKPEMNRENLNYSIQDCSTSESTNYLQFSSK